jgi:TonB family protein
VLFFQETPMILIALALAMAAPSSPPDEQGKAVVDCRVTPAGWMRDCKVVSESPAAANVGAFALKLAKGFHVQPGDRRIKDGRIRLPLQFKLPGR